MSVERNKEVTRLTIEEVMNKSNLALIPDLFAPDYVHRSAAGQEIKGHEGWRQNVIDGHAAFPDLHYRIDELVGEGDKVVCRITGTGTFRGEYMGMAPNGRRFNASSMFVNTFREGKIVETWAVANPLISMQQLGISPPGFVPSQEKNKAAIRRTVEEIWNKGNVSLIPEQISPDYVAHNAGLQDYKGREGFREMVTGMRAAFPDLHYAIDHMVCEGDKVVCSCTITGTNTGPMMGMPPTGKKMAIKHTYISAIKDGKSVETWALADRLSIYQQLGITPPSASATS